jgi:hypothetical protein
MARPVHTEPTGKGQRAKGRKHLNASLPQQLVFDFNSAAKKLGHGKRDAVVEDLLRRFLEMVDPTCESLQQPSSSSFGKQRPSVNLASREGADLRYRLAENEVIRIARQHAEEIVQATSGFMTRKPPKRASSAGSHIRVGMKRSS